MIEAFFTLNRAEYLEAQQIYIRHKARLSRRRRFSLYALLLIGVFTLLWTMTDPRYALNVTVIALIGGLALGFFAKYVLQARMLKQRFKTELRFLTDVHLALDDDGFYSKSEGIGEAKLEWNAYTSWSEGKTVFVLLVGFLFRPIPKRTLSEDQQAELRHLLTRKIGEANITRKP